MTVSPAQSGDFIRSLVESKPPGHHSNIVEIVAAKLDSLTSSILSSEKMAKEAMSDLLKMAFNFLLHYPKVSLCSTVGDLPIICMPSDGRHQLVCAGWRKGYGGLLERQA